MVIWINGPFGVGKTTVANELNKLLSESFIYDPENIGAFLRENLKYNYKDYQEYELWRKFNYEIIKDLSLHYDKIIVPMTLTNKIYYEQIIGKLQKDSINVKHIILEAKKEIIIERLNNRIDTTSWAYQQIDKCLKAFEHGMPGEKINTNNKTVGEIVNIIIDKLKQ